MADDPTAEVPGFDLDLIRARHDAADEAWSWHDATDDTIAGYGFHMSQLLARMPRDSQTRDMKASIDVLLDDLDAALYTIDRIAALADELDNYATSRSGGRRNDLDASADAVRRVVAGRLRDRIYPGKRDNTPGLHAEGVPSSSSESSGPVDAETTAQPGAIRPDAPDFRGLETPDA